MNPLGYASHTHGPRFPDARLDAQMAHAAAAVAAVVGDPPLAHRRHDALGEPSPHELPVERLPPPPPYPPGGYVLPTHGPLFPEAQPHHAPASRGPPPPFPGRHSPPPQRGGHTNRGNRRPTKDPVFIGRAAHDATGFDKEALNRSMKMSVPTMRPTADFKQ
jgi:hypothetical protein